MWRTESPREDDSHRSINFPVRIKVYLESGKPIATVESLLEQGDVVSAELR